MVAGRSPAEEQAGFEHRDTLSIAITAYEEVRFWRLGAHFWERQGVKRLGRWVMLPVPGTAVEEFKWQRRK